MKLSINDWNCCYNKLPRAAPLGADICAVSRHIIGVLGKTQCLL